MFGLSWQWLVIIEIMPARRQFADLAIDGLKHPISKEFGYTDHLGICNDAFLFNVF